jgi:hypothetical protein
MNDGRRQRGRFRFGLRALFVFVTLAAVWAAYSVHWIRQRREFVRAMQAGPSTAIAIHEGVLAPGLLWLFGESGVEDIGLQSPDESDVQEARRLFPEAQVGVPPEWIWTQSTEAQNVVMDASKQPPLVQLAQIFGVIGFLYCAMDTADNNLPFKVIGVVLLGIVVVPTIAYRIWRR